MSTKRVLSIGQCDYDHGNIARKLRQHFGAEVVPAATAEEGLELISRRPPNIVFLDVRMPGRDGVQALQDIRAQFPQVYVVMMTAYGTSQTSIDTIRAGAFDYLTKPLDLDVLRTVIAKALAVQQVRDSSGEPAGADPAASGVRLIGEAPAIQEVYKMIGRLATNDVPALILGERGTGKELIARTIHESSRRSSEPFVMLDGESMPEAVLESALLSRDGGSVYISTIERMPALLQSRLTRALTSDRTD
jgi:DNA-binding NtrC family response regulator